MFSSELIERKAVEILNYSERVCVRGWLKPFLSSWKSFGLVASALKGLPRIVHFHSCFNKEKIA